MRSVWLVLLLLFGGTAPGQTTTSLPPVTPEGLRGLVPLESPELALALVDGGVWAIFTGLSGRSSGIYARRFDQSQGQWGALMRLSMNEESADTRPATFVDAEGGVHAAWLSRPGRKKYEILYRHLRQGSNEWSPLQRFEAGRGESSPQFGGDPGGQLFLYSGIATDQDQWGRIAFWSSHDQGQTWAEADPNFPEDLKHGGATAPVAVSGPDGQVWLAWLDQTPGGRSVVLNASRDGGETWLKTPIAVNTDKRFSLSNARLLANEAGLHVFWTVTLLEKSGKKTQFWTDRSSDGGETWMGNKQFHASRGSDVSLGVYSVGADVGCVWSERRPRPAGAALSEVVVWRNGNLVSSKATALLELPEGSQIPAFSTLSMGSNLTVFYADQDFSDGGQVAVLHRTRPGEAWETTELSEEKAVLRATAPAGVFDSKVGQYIVGFHEVRRIRFIGEPPVWNSSLKFLRFKLPSSKGDE